MKTILQSSKYWNWELCEVDLAKIREIFLPIAETSGYPGIKIVEEKLGSGQEAKYYFSINMDESYPPGLILGIQDTLKEMGIFVRQL